MRLLLRLGVTLVAVLVGGVLAFLYMPAIGSPSPAALHYSVAREVGGSVLASGGTRCRRARERVFRCSVSDASGSGGAVYVVRRDGRCWRARRTNAGGGERELKKRATGCVKWRDQIRLADRI